ncbi:MAG: hypothetical protein AVDCRST_MAG93-7873 [uncultured Chloroflexia bacterium]|uniref:Apea-like HEPN domain-containing protein n=1 Tax=uncultured Chloroflexia bacterium TaxID=1672391 RepID=A0A6J4MRL9_9CHLR|nr:MAG: hypothetical protein AVDCRST_MAG93-7873 [uncultured Chloroflexia bacterium]
MILDNHEVPVAYSMRAMAEDPVHSASQPLQDFVCYWTAFNNIYVTVAEKRGRRASLRRFEDGTLRTRPVAHVRIPQVVTVRERDQIDLAFDELDADLKQKLVEHAGTRFFAHRTPRWQGCKIELDALGQRLNGVINVGYTVDADHPVWSPIDTDQYESYMHGDRDPETRDALARQVLDLLYTVRNNAFHGGKRADDADDHQVMGKALQLLTLVVAAFLQDPRVA